VEDLVRERKESPQPGSIQAKTRRQKGQGGKGERKHTHLGPKPKIGVGRMQSLLIVFRWKKDFDHKSQTGHNEGNQKVACAGEKKAVRSAEIKPNQKFLRRAEMAKRQGGRRKDRPAKKSRTSECWFMEVEVNCQQGKAQICNLPHGRICMKSQEEVRVYTRNLEKGAESPSLIAK